MKIAVIGIEKISINLGKIEQHCQELYTKIAARGHQVDIFASTSNQRYSWFSVRYYKNIRIITLLFASKRHLFGLFNTAFSTIWATFSNYDVIHIYGVKNALFAWFARLFNVTKIVLTCCQLDYPKHHKNKFWLTLCRWIEKQIVRHADEIIVDSKALKTYFRQQHNIEANYIPNAPRSLVANERTFDYGKALGLKARKYIICLGKLEPDCKPDLLIEAFQKLKPSDWKLVFIGDIGNHLQYTSRIMAGAQLNKVIFINDTQGYASVEMISHAGLLVAPSNEVNLKFPLGMLEVMREGIPVIASDITIHQEIIGRDRGLLFSAGQSESLFTQLKYALSEPTSLQPTMEKAQTYVSINHNWDRVVYKNLFLYLKTTLKIANQSRKYRTSDN